MKHTADSIRTMTAGPEMDALVERSVLGNVVKRDEHLGYGRYTKEGGWDHVPHYSTGLVANAELKRHLWASGVFYVEASLRRFAHPVAFAAITDDPGDTGNVWEHEEPIATDPIAAEMLAWCKVALLAAIEEGRVG